MSFDTRMFISENKLIKSVHKFLLAVESPYPLLLFPPSVTIIPIKKADLMDLFDFFIIFGI